MNVRRPAGVAAAALLLAFTNGNDMEIADEVEEVHNALFYARSVWQIDSIEIE